MQKHVCPNTQRMYRHENRAVYVLNSLLLMHQQCVVDQNRLATATSSCICEGGLMFVLIGPKCSGGRGLEPLLQRST